MESLAFVIMYLKRGSLPWMGMPGKTKHERYARIKKRKIDTTLEDLSRGSPAEFREFLEQCRIMKFEQEPDYDHLISFFRKALKSEKLNPYDFNYSWKKQHV